MDNPLPAMYDDHPSQGRVRGLKDAVNVRDCHPQGDRVLLYLAQHHTSFVVLMRIFLSFGGIKLQCGFTDSPSVGWRS